MKIAVKDLPATMQRFAENYRRNVRQGLRKGLTSALRTVVRFTPKDTGRLRKSWRLSFLGDDRNEIRNNCPYAGTVENGSNPHVMSPAERGQIREWFERQIFKKAGSGEMPDEAERELANLFKHLEEDGQKPLFFSRKAMPYVSRIVWYAIQDSLKSGIS